MFCFPYVGEIRKQKYVGLNFSAGKYVYSQYMPSGCWRQEQTNGKTKYIDFSRDYEGSHILCKSIVETLNKEYANLYSFRLENEKSLIFTMKSGEKYHAILSNGNVSINRV